MIVRITTAQVCRIYDNQVHCGVLRDAGALAGAVNTPFQEVFGLVPYPSVVQKAGKLLDGIQRVQAFTDGNKRVAWLSTTSFLQINGQVIDPLLSPEEIDDFVRSLARMEQPEVVAAAWLNERTHGTV